MPAATLTATDGNSRVRIEGDTAAVSFKVNNSWKVWRTGRITEQSGDNIIITFALRKGRLTNTLEQSITADFAGGSFHHTGGGDWVEE